MVTWHWFVSFRRCRDISVVGLWAGDMDPDSSLKMLEAVRAKTGISNLRVRHRYCSVVAGFGGPAIPVS